MECYASWKHRCVKPEKTLLEVAVSIQVDSETVAVPVRDGGRRMGKTVDKSQYPVVFRVDDGVEQTHLSGPGAPDQALPKVSTQPSTLEAVLD